MANGMMPGGGGGQPMPGGNGMMPPGAEPPMPEEGGQGQGRKATSEEQHTHDEFISNAVNALYQKPMVQSVMTMMQETKFTPANTLANIAAMIVSSTLASAEENGMQVSPPIVAKAAAKIISEVSTEMLPAKKMQPVPEDQMKAALARSMEVLREQREGPQQEGPPQQGAEASPTPGLAPPGPGGNGMMPGAGGPPPVQ